MLVQLTSAFSLLLGTIAFVLVMQNGSGGHAYAIAWAAGSMVAIVLGGLMARGGMISVIGGALLVATFGTVLLVLDWDTLRAILRLLPEDDVVMVADALVGGAVAMLVVAALALASIPQARRYHRAYKEAEQNEQAMAAASGSAMYMPAQPAATMPPMPPMAPMHHGPPRMPPPAPQIGASWNVGPAMPPPPPGQYVDPLTPFIPTAASTARGWTPSPARTYTTMQLQPPAVEARSRRRIYFALGGLAIGVGAGVGVIVSSMADGPTETSTSSAVAAKPTDDPAPPPTTDTSTATVDASPETAAVVDASVVAPTVPVRELLTVQRALIATADAKALSELALPGVIGFGLDADDVIEGRASYEAMLLEHLGDTPPDGFEVTSKFLAVGEQGNHAWVAEELEIDGGDARRRIAITQLVAFVDGAWKVVAVHWGTPVPDETAERRAMRGTLPRPKAVTAKADGGADLDTAVRAAFASRTAFAEARSEREDGFNFGSAPGERIVGGARIKGLFGRLRSQLKLTGGVRAIAGGAWDPAQASASWIGVAALHADYTHRSKAATDVTQTFRVLAILLREGDRWTIVQTQFSNGGPL